MFAVESTVGLARPLAGSTHCYGSPHGPPPWLGNPVLSAVSTLGIQDQMGGWIKTQGSGHLAGPGKVAPPYQGAFLLLPSAPKCLLVGPS